MSVDQYWKGLVRPDSTESLELVGHPDMGRAFNRQAYRVRLASLERALGAIGAESEWRIFEGAYGVGFYLAYWQRRGHRHVVGVDLSADACEVTRRAFPAYDLRSGDLSAISSWPDWRNLAGTFDLVTAIDVLYHVVDDELAATALGNLGDLTAPGKYLVVTDKFGGLERPLQETKIVTRRPLAWYAEVLKPLGLHLVETFPMMWVTDPPTRYGTPWPLRVAARAAWVGARASLKWLPRNGRLQNRLGALVGGGLAELDLRLLPHVDAVPNLTIAVFRRQEGDAPAAAPTVAASPLRRRS